MNLPAIVLALLALGPQARDLFSPRLDEIIEAAEANFGFLFGRAFIDKTTLEILKIEWSEQRIGNYEVFEKRGERYGMKPHISVASEFDVEKNGIRFPSRHSIEEAYINKKGKKFVRSETSVAYTDFRFFTVETETDFTKQDFPGHQ